MRTARWLTSAALLLVAAVAAGWWWWPAPLQPPMPAGIEDEEVVEAIRAAQEPVRAAPRSAAAWGQLGKVIMAQQFDREADFCFAEAARLDPADARWRYGRAIIALKRRPDDAVALLREAAAAPDCSPEYRSAIRLQLAEALLERGQLDDADTLFRAEQERARGNSRAILGLGLIAQARGQTGAAVQLLNRVRSSPSARKVATAQLACIARAQGDAGQAALYDQQLATMSGDAVWPDPFHEELAALRVGQRGWERKIKQLEQESKFAQAAQLYLERLEKHPRAELYAGAGLNLARLPDPDYDQALALLREAVRLEPDSSYAHYVLGRVLYNRAERVTQTAPDTPRAKEWFQEAVTHTRRATELRWGYAEAYLFWGLSLKYLGQWEAALEPLHRGVDCQPRDFRLQFVLGEALFETGRLEQAKTHLEYARAIEPNNVHVEHMLERLRKRDH
jgi:tetratricopeptide (TPR) repeat protein